MPPLSIDFEADNMVGPFSTGVLLRLVEFTAWSNVSVVSVTGVPFVCRTLMNFISNMWFIEPRKYLVVSSNHKKVEKIIYANKQKTSCYLLPGEKKVVSASREG